jgi:hypothetical protein
MGSHRPRLATRQNRSVILSEANFSGAEGSAFRNPTQKSGCPILPQSYRGRVGNHNPTRTIPRNPFSTLPLASFPHPHPPVELLTLSARHGQRLPSASLQVFCQEHNLPAMIAVMRHLPVDRLHHGMRLAANRYFLRQIILTQRLQRSKHASPSLFPRSQYRLARLRRIHKLQIPPPVRLFTIAG